jgi:hypothetical protein
VIQRFRFVTAKHHGMNGDFVPDDAALLPGDVSVGAAKVVP